MRFIALALLVLFALLPNPGSANPSGGQKAPAEEGGIKARAIGVSETRERRLLFLWPTRQACRQRVAGSAVRG